MKLFKLTYRNISVNMFFAALFFVGFRIYQNYGISWDEPVSRVNGFVTLKYLHGLIFQSIVVGDETFSLIESIKSYRDHDYGVAFEGPAAAIEYMLGLKDTRDIYMFRHLLTFLVSMSGVFAVFRLVERRFSDWRWGLLASLFLVLSPRIFAESFYNDKDVVFMAIFAVATNTSVGFLLRPTLRRALINALATAIAIDVRIMGIILPVGVTFLLAIQIIPSEMRHIKSLMAPVLYIFATSIFIVLFWPWLWENPGHNFYEALTNMAKFRWNGSVLFMGDEIPATQLPWYYAPVWICITTPIFYVAMFLSGVLLIARRMFCAVVSKNLSCKFLPWQNSNDIQDVLFIALFILPIISIIALHSVLYDGWRQLYFLYPAFLLVTMRGVHFWVRNGKVGKVVKAALAAAMAFSLGYTAIWMINSHPLQNVYFNVLAGSSWRSHYDLDYWGLGNRQGLEFLLKTEASNDIKIWSCSWTPLAESLQILRPEERRRITVVKTQQDADFVLNNFRGNLDNCPGKALQSITPSTGYRPYFQVKIGDEIILSIVQRVAGGV